MSRCRSSRGGCLFYQQSLVIFAISPKIDDAKEIPKLLFAPGVGFPAFDPNISESQIETATFVVNQIGYEEYIEI